MIYISVGNQVKIRSNYPISSIAYKQVQYYDRFFAVVSLKLIDLNDMSSRHSCSALRFFQPDIFMSRMKKL